MTLHLFLPKNCLRIPESIFCPNLVAGIVGFGSHLPLLSVVGGGCCVGGQISSGEDHFWAIVGTSSGVVGYEG